ncbi:AAA family ATPase [Danxiaibacter flavus]|uniref:AAA family ATPase n=1 Tax=Danxiaibacter flavus TaxID=3049108 RepID=A0ABV3ZN04_9BACT|nr:AAA family ATPase [Chitinophagaceae bacterium DXS]
MAKVQLKSLTLINFKGIKNLVIHFKHITDIFGDNGTGKTTVFDGFTWLLFDKDCNNNTKFGIKNLDKDGKTTDQTEIHVSAELDVDGKIVSPKKVMREKWTTKKGRSKTEFTGNENIHFWNDVPVKQSEFDKKVSDILDEGLFKLITNPLYFNRNLKWQDRRNVLMELAGNISNSEIAASNAKFRTVLDALSNKTLIEYKREIGAKKSKIKTELDSIPTRIDELVRSRPEMMDFNAIRTQLLRKETELENQDNYLLDRSKANSEYHNKVVAWQNNIHSLKNSMRNIEFEERQKATSSTSQKVAQVNNLTREISDKKGVIKSKAHELNTLEQQLLNSNSARDMIRKEWMDENEKVMEPYPEFTFDESSCFCPTCKQHLPDGDIATKKGQLLTNHNEAQAKYEISFNESKTKKLAELNAKGVAEKKNGEILAERIEKAKAALVILEDELKALESKLASLESDSAPVINVDEVVANALVTNPEYTKLKTDLELAEANPVKEEKVDLSSLQQAKTAIQAEIQGLQRTLMNEELIENANVRQAELEQQQKTLAQELADLENIEFTLDEFNRAKLDMVESRINGKFKYAKFKLFERQVNGGEVECCETTYNGVPFSDLNTASQIWVGLDIINTLREHFNADGPVFLDNRESVCQIPETTAQIINLFVSPQDKKLRVA